MMNGMKVSYSLYSNYFAVGKAYRLHLGANDFRIGLLVKYTPERVTFKILENGDITDLSLTVNDLRTRDYGIIRMMPDYEHGEFSKE